MMQNVDNRPYWQYVAVLDRKTRPAHRDLHGKVFRYDDPFWETHYPPLGFNCRCRVRALSQADIDKQNLVVDSGEGKIEWEDALISKKTGELRPVAVYRDPMTGEKIATEVGWSYNPGKAAFVPDVSKYDTDIRELYFKDSPYFKHIKDVKLRDAIQADVEKALPEARLIIEKYKLSCKYETTKQTSCHASSQKTIFLNITQTKTMNGVFIHEFAHHIDEIFKLSYSKEFRKAFWDDFSNLISIRVPEVQDIDGKYRSHPSVSGMFDALTEGKIIGVYGHRKTYWVDPALRVSEFFADMFTTWATDKKAWKEIVGRYFHFTVRVFQELLKRIK